MSILQVAGEDSEFGILGGGVNTADNTKFRPSYARCSIYSGFGQAGYQLFLSGDLKTYLDAQPAGDKDFWYAYRWVGGGGFITGLAGMHLYDSTKPFLRFVSVGAGDSKLQTSTDGFASNITDYPASVITQPNTPTQYSFRVKIHPTLGHIEWYIGTSLWFVTPNGDTTGLCAGSPYKLLWACPNSNGVNHISEFISTSSDDPPVGMSLVTLVPSGDGLTGWAGGYTAINEAVKDPSTQNTTAVAATDVSYDVTDTPALAGSTIIRALIVSGEYVAAATAPQHLNQFLRFAGVVYPGPLRTVAAVLGLLQTIWHTSPVTATTLTEAEVNAVQIGMRSAA